jgi:hypothetical protein
MEASALQFYVTASDSNPNQPPTVSATNVPTGAALTFITRSQAQSTCQYRFNWTPTYTQSGIYYVLFQALDPQGLIDTERVTITVIEAGNQRPHWASSFPTDTVKQSVRSTYSLHVLATDLDNPILTLSILNRPRNATFVDSGNSAGLFAFVPDPTQADSIYDVRFVASDGLLADTAKVIFKMIAFDRGDVNADREFDVFDVTYLIDYLFSGGPAPLPVIAAGDVDGNGVGDVLDLIYLIAYVFSGGPAPPP